MALFDFLKKRRKQEKQEKKSREAHSRSEAPAVARGVKNSAESAQEGVKEAEKLERAREAIIEERYHEDIAVASPHITEKSRTLSENGSYVFQVLPHADKRAVKNSIERLYHVHVENVQMTHVPPRPRRRGLTSGRKGGYKKAVVRLQKGETIDIY